MKKFVVFMIMVLTIFAKDSYEIEGKVGRMESSKGNFEVLIEDIGDEFKFVISADTEGWLAIGFEAGFAMDEAEMIMAYLDDNGIAKIEHHYGVSKFKHKEISGLMEVYPKDAIKLESFTFSEGRSTYVILRKKDLVGDYFKELYSGKEIELLYAYRKDNNIKKKHSKAEHIDIILP